MTTPAQPAVPTPAKLPDSPGDELESWFDQELRPVLLRHIAEADRRIEARHAAPFASIRHWLNELPGRGHQRGKETEAFANVMASELRGLLGDD